MLYGQLPFADLRFNAKLKSITNPNHKIDFPPFSNPWHQDIVFDMESSESVDYTGSWNSCSTLSYNQILPS
jgi:hypothetical protein